MSLAALAQGSAKVETLKTLPIQDSRLEHCKSYSAIIRLIHSVDLIFRNRLPLFGISEF